MEGNTPEQWYKNLPKCTRVVMTAIFGITVLVTLELFNPAILILDWVSVVKRLNIWRLWSNVLFFGPFGFPWLINIYLFVSFSARLEKNEVFSGPGGVADYLFFLLFSCVAIDTISLFLAWPRGLPINGSSLIMCIIYYWSRREAWAPLSYWGFSIQGYQLPWALMFFNLLMGGSPWKDLVGVAAGHLWYFLTEVLPAEYGSVWLKTPRLLYTAVSRLQPPQRAAGPAPAPPTFGGRGHRLGGD